jgi:hypothetical protein
MRLFKDISLVTRKDLEDSIEQQRVKLVQFVDNVHDNMNGKLHKEPKDIEICLWIESFEIQRLKSGNSTPIEDIQRDLKNFIFEYEILLEASKHLRKEKLIKSFLKEHYGVFLKSSEILINELKRLKRRVSATNEMKIKRLMQGIS